MKGAYWGSRVLQLTQWGPPTACGRGFLSVQLFKGLYYCDKCQKHIVFQCILWCAVLCVAMKTMSVVCIMVADHILFMTPNKPVRFHFMLTRWRSVPLDSRSTLRDLASPFPANNTTVVPVSFICWNVLPAHFFGIQPPCHTELMAHKRDRKLFSS